MTAYIQEADRCAEFRHFELTSLMELRSRVGADGSSFLRDVIKRHTLVGIVNEDYILIQYLTALYLVKSSAFLQELFYQLILFRFGNFGSIQLSQPVAIASLLPLAEEADSESEQSLRSKVDEFTAKLTEMSDMLKDYFSLGISKDGKLESIPRLVCGPSIAPLGRLSDLLWWLGSSVNWKHEKRCLEGVGRNLARFFSLPGDRGGTREESWTFLLEHTLLPTMRAKLLPPDSLTKNGAIRKLTDLKDLYKVFERC